MLRLLTWALLPILCAAANVLSRNILRSRDARITRHRYRKGGGRGPVEALEEWKDSGARVKTGFSDDNLLELAQGIDGDIYGRELHQLVDSTSSRFVAHQGNTDTADYIKQQFKDMGLDVTEEKITDSRISKWVNLLSSTHPDDVTKDGHSNIIGLLKGSDLAHEVVLLGAHYDSVNWEDTSASAPGVDDNGSGSALMLAAARALTQAGDKFRPRRSVMFVAFNAEEVNLVGSEHFVQLFKKDGPGRNKYGDLKAVFIADEVAWPGRGKEQRKATFETVGQKPGTTAMVDTLAHMAFLTNKTSSAPGDGLGDGVHNFLVNYHGFGSDHISFLNEGIPAVLLIERDNDNHAEVYGHSARDTFEHVDLSYGASMTRLALRSVAAFANPA